MAIASFRSFIGVAKDTINCNIAATTASGAVTISVTNVMGTPATAMTMVIVDGPLTETVTVSAYVAGTLGAPGTLTVSATTQNHSANVYCYLQLTSAVGPTAYIAVNTMDFSDDYTQLYDKGFRGSQADIFGAEQGTRVANISLDGALFPDTFGYLLSSFFGAYDYTATASTVPTQYTFSPYNKTNGQPNSILLYDYNPAGGAAGQTAGNTRVYANFVVSDLAIKFAPGAVVEYTATAKSFASGVVTNPGTIPPSFSTFTPLPARTTTVSMGQTLTGCSSVTTANTCDSTAGLQAGMSLTFLSGTAGAFPAGTTVSSITDATHFVSSAAASPALSTAIVSASSITAKVENADYTFKRQAFAEIWTLNGTQDPMDMFGGPVSVSVKTSLVVDDDVQLNNYILQSQPSFTLTARTGVGVAATDNGITIQCSQANYESVKLMQHGKPYVILDVPFQAIANTTDKTTAGGGLSPVKVTLSTKTTGTTSLY